MSKLAVHQNRPAHTRRLGFESLETRHLLAGVVINELYYDHTDANARGEFVELHNSSGNSIDISGWAIDRGVDYNFPVLSSIEAGEYLVIAENSSDFQSIFGFAPFGEWQVGDKLSNDGERIELLNAAGSVVDTLRYRLGFPWPTPVEGQSIELINPGFDNSEGGAWRSTGAESILVAENSTWSYRKGISNNPPADWADSGFDVSSDNVAWQSDNATFGYGDGDDTTLLLDMQDGYSSVYFRHDFQLNGALPDSLSMRLYVDDGAIIYINGEEITREHVNNQVKNFNSTSGANHEAAWEDITLDGLDGILTSGTNTLAIHGLNQSSGSSDFSLNAELRLTGSSTSPGAQNVSFATNSPPFIENVQHSLDQPQSNQDVLITADITDPDGIATATVQYQIVEAGDYIAIDDPRYTTQWALLSMVDNGTGDDVVAGDGTFTATVPANLQTHRRLIRYRVLATDGLAAEVLVPYADDPTPNFAYYVYDATPDWTGAIRPGVTTDVTYDAATLDSVATYQLITTRENHEDAQHIPDTATNSYGGSDYLWQGALVYDGTVYDHIRYRARGGVWRYAMGKNMWKFDFNKGRDFFAKDNYGNEFAVGWDKLNLGANIQQGNFWHRGEQGLFESVGFRMFEMAGVAAPNTNYVHFRIVENESETGADQYSGDFQGLYLAIEQLDGNFLDQHDLADGNLYKMENGTGVGGIGGDSNNQGDFPEVTDSSDLIEFKNTYESGTQTAQWWEDNFDLDSYYNYRSIVEAIHHGDIANGKNYFYYHDPVTDKWQTLPWDLDLTWANNMFGNGNEPFKSRVLAISQFAQGYRNRLREIRDLLYNPDQAGAVIDEQVALVNAPGQPSLVEADRAMWDYNPIMTSGYVNSSKSGEGLFYAGGGGVPATGSFAGMAQKMKDYVVSRGNFIDATILTDDGQIPIQPTISYVGAAGHPVDNVAFSTDPFSDPNGDSFGAMEWRIGEISNPSTANFDPNVPWVYEMDAVWESGELSTYNNLTDVDTANLTPGRTYRARVRMMDANNNWSHWSEPVEFVASVPEGGTLAVTEVHYHPLNPALANENDQEFMEFLNTGAQPLDLSGAQIVDFSTTPYVFAAGTILQPGQYFVVARTPSVFQSVYGHANLAASGYANSNLGNSGDTITVLSEGGSQILSFTYDDMAPWPAAADGTGPSMEIINPLGSLTDPTNWRASAEVGGSPGRANTPLLAGDYDRNGVVEQADRAAWDLQFGTIVMNPGDGADGNLNCIVDAADYTIWRDNLGAVNAVGAIVTSVMEDSLPTNEFVAAANPNRLAASKPHTLVWLNPPTNRTERRITPFVGPLLHDDWVASLRENATLDLRGRAKVEALPAVDFGALGRLDLFANESDWWREEDE